jgi:hypothetical protein
MKMTSPDLDSILDYIENYEADGIDKEVAIHAAVAIARGIWKRDHPDTSQLPDHLKPGNVVKAIMEGREARASKSSEG